MLSKMCDTREQYSAMGYRASAKKKAIYWPTPSATDYKGAGMNGDLMDRLDYAVERGGTKSKTYEPNLTGGQLNPNWVGWLMGFPIAWANSKATVTPKSRSKQQPPTDCSEDFNAP